MSKVKIRPLHDRVVIKQLAEEEKTAGGIIIPDSSKEKPTQGEVMAIGSGFVMNDGSLRPLDVSVGDKVIFPSWQADASKVKVDGEEFLVMKEDDIIAICEA